jgi:hypothetical protein
MLLRSSGIAVAAERWPELQVARVSASNWLVTLLLGVAEDWRLLTYVAKNSTKV